MHKVIKIKFQNGITKGIALNEILNELTHEYEFVESDEPDFVLFGPYGNQVPPKGAYTRIGYFCENITPDFSSCEWAFGVPAESEFDNPAYRRIQWHNLNPNALVKEPDYDTGRVLAGKKHFCNFLYSHRVPYREDFFKQLSKYKKIDAPGKSMNNMQPIDAPTNSDKWAVKQQFLSQYKFTISFENYSYPGYQTEKLYDAMIANSIPVYCGDPFIGQLFNTAAFVNVGDEIDLNGSPLINFLSHASQPDFVDIRPAFFNDPYHRIKRKLKAWGRDLKMQAQFNRSVFDRVINRIIELDNDDETYLAMLRQPWLNGNKAPESSSLNKRWMTIFEGKSPDAAS